MYVKISNGAVEQYPYTLGNLRRDNPNTSFPKVFSEEMLADWGVYSVVHEATPNYDPQTQRITHSAEPALINGEWTITCSVVNFSSEEIAAANEMIASSNRGKRDQELAETDWWALPDSPTMTAEQTAYRQSLRDITTHVNWPNLSDDDWPTKL